MKQYVICFDIQDDKVRVKLSRLLEKYGTRVQGSVFECAFKSIARKQALQAKIKQLIKQSKFEEKNIRFYNLDKNTLANSHDINQNLIANLPAVIVL